MMDALATEERDLRLIEEARDRWVAVLNGERCGSLFVYHTLYYVFDELDLEVPVWCEEIVRLCNCSGFRICDIGDYCGNESYNRSPTQIEARKQLWAVLIHTAKLRVHMAKHSCSS